MRSRVCALVVGATERERRGGGTRRWGLHSQIEWRGREGARGRRDRLIHADTEVVTYTHLPSPNFTHNVNFTTQFHT